ncbi:Topoisomerase DNA binding C4 zinc finger [Planococcus glaciei]|uniref:nuclease-related domain-containing protein n=1 Tax=Planococcus glaciei TaxID=459472 RepID=UPI00087FBA55|nr:NERD domain-containing protein [Planococcus glaciei]SDI35015.1 Topoisomerase DNA binding C4 zinc finger [Planococcus glaciei]
MPFLFLLFMIILAAVLKSPVVKGFFGELGVRSALNRLDIEDFRVLHNITLSDGKKTTQIDHVVIGRTGIFVIETKNYKGWIFGSENSAKWTQTIYNSRRQFQNPIRQNYGHIKMLEHHFPGYKQPMVSIISFSGNSVLKKVDVASSHIHVLHTAGIVRAIRSYQETILSKPAIAAFADHLEKANIKDPKLKKQHVQTIKETEHRKKRQFSANICPNCGSPLVSRIGKHGNFKGCSSFPTCRFTA